MTKAMETTDSTSHFQTGGSDYQLYRPTYSAELVQSLANLCSNRRLALDVGCGTGQLSQLIADYFALVIATDVSVSQLQNVQPRSNIKYLCETAEAMSLESSQADLIVSAQAAHWFNLDRFYSEVKRVAAKDAVLVLVSYGVPYIESHLNSWFQRFYWQDLAPHWPQERYHVETGYQDLPFPFASIPMPAFFIRRAWTYSQFMGYLHTWSGIKKLLSNGEGRLLEMFEQRLSVLWQDADANSEPTQQIVWPLSLRVGMVG